MGGNTEDISLQTCAATQDDQKLTTNENAYSKLYDSYVSANVEKNLDPAHIAVYVNGVIVPASSYQYNPETGVINVSGFPASINTITVEKINDAEKTVTDQVFDDVDLKTQNLNYDTDMNYTSMTPLKIPTTTKVGDYVAGTSTYYYTPWVIGETKPTATEHPEYYADVPEINKQALIGYYNNGTLHFTYRYQKNEGAPDTPTKEWYENFIKWVNDGTPFSEQPYLKLFANTVDNWGGVAFMADFADGEADFKFENGATLDVTPLNKEIFTCVHVENPFIVSNLNNGEVTPLNWNTHKFSNFPMRMRFYKLTEDYAVIGIIAARSESRDSATLEISDQASYGLIKVPIQRTGNRVLIEKDDESNKPLAGAEMELYKDSVSDTPYDSWKTAEVNPKDFNDEEAGTYVITEKEAPSGYQKINPVTFTVDEENTIKITNDGNNTVTVDQKNLTIHIVDKAEPTTPVKTEPTPGPERGVNVGDRITYKLDYENYKSGVATVKLTDKLDDGVKFISADNNGQYDLNTHTIKWTFENIPAKAPVSATFVVEVTDKAVRKVLNQGIGQVDNDPEYTTEIIRNPLIVPPVKTEPIPGPNKGVDIGDTVSYKVKATNYMLDPCTVIIKDILDPGVDFKSADNNGQYDEATRTITWTLENVPVDKKVEVGFDVVVNKNAGEIIENKARAKVGIDPEIETNIIKNPLIVYPVKEELDPGEGQYGPKGVRKDDIIEYKVSEKNYLFTDSDMIIKDKLDESVEFISADNEGQYDPTTHTITWNLFKVKSGEYGVVTFKVKVNDKSEGKDIIPNDASTKLEGERELKTPPVKNPVMVPPVKAESEPGDRRGVHVGDTVKYTVTQKNYLFEDAPITFTDKLDEGIDFVKADNDGKYDEATRTITWTVDNVKSGEEVTVGFEVVVNKEIEKDNLIENQAKTVVGDEREQETNIVKNPLIIPPVKAEPTPGEEVGVRSGDEVTYTVTQKNYLLDDSNIIITDKLDPGVDFVSADNNGKYDKETRTVKWTLENVLVGKEAVVKFVVKVNDSASEKILNKAITKVGEDPENETNEIRNPIIIDPVKTELTPGEGKQVKIGDEVNYKVHFTNYKFDKATVVVTDKLDPGVDFVSADNNGTYDKASHSITWTFKDMEARKEQDVTFKVKVNDKAGNVIRNQAEVKVGNDPIIKTNIIENPVIKPNAKTGVIGDNNNMIFIVIAALGIAAIGVGVYYFNKKVKKQN